MTRGTRVFSRRGTWGCLATSGEFAPFIFNNVNGVHMNQTFRALLIGALSACSAMIAGNATATTTGATASAFVSGIAVRQSFTAGAEGTQATAAQVIPSSIGDVFVTAQASSVPGALRAAGVARTNGSPGGFQGLASASWADSFVISASAYDSSMTGTFSGAVEVTGELLVAFLGRVYSDAQIYATVVHPWPRPLRRSARTTPERVDAPRRPTRSVVPRR